MRHALFPFLEGSNMDLGQRAPVDKLKINATGNDCKTQGEVENNANANYLILSL